MATTSHSQLIYSQLDTDNDELSKKSLGGGILQPGERGWLLAVKILGAILLFFSAAAAFVLVLLPSTQTQFTRFLTITTDFRNGAPLQSDHYPAIVEAAVSTNGIDVGLTAAFVSALGWLAFTFNALFHGAEIEQLNRGSDPYFWLSSMLWLPIAVILWAVVSGVHNPFVLGLLATISWAFLDLLWADDLMHSNAYIYALQLSATLIGAVVSAAWSWVTYVQALFQILVLFIVIFVYLGFTFGGAVAPAAIILVIALTGPLFYLVLGPVLIIPISRAGWIESVARRYTYLYVHAFLTIIIATWLTLVIYATNPNI